MKWRVLIALCMALHSGGVWAADGGRDLARAIITQLGQVPERTRTFHETRGIGALTHPLVSTGILVFHRPAYLRKDTLAPHPEDMIMDGDTVSIRRGSGAVHVVTLSQNPALSLLATTLRAPLEGDRAALERYYALAASGDARGWTLVMTPLGADGARVVRTVTLTGRNNVIDTLRVVQANGDVRTLTLDP